MYSFFLNGHIVYHFTHSLATNSNVILRANRKKVLLNWFRLNYYKGWFPYDRYDRCQRWPEKTETTLQRSL